MKLVLVLTVLMFTLGCCCSLPDGSEEGTTTTLTGQPGVVCNAPYIRHGRECCLDSDGSGICDVDEVTSTELGTTSRATTTTTLPETTTTVVVTTAQTTTTTTKPLGQYVECVSGYGVSPDTVLYLYTDECCKSGLNPYVEAVEAQGYNIRYINLATPSSTDTAVIYCIRSTMPNTVPEFICSGNGNSILMLTPSRLKVKNFAEECKNAV